MEGSDLGDRHGASTGRNQCSACSA